MEKKIGSLDLNPDFYLKKPSIMLTILDLYLALPSQHHQCLETYSCSAYTERETEKIIKEKPGMAVGRIFGAGSRGQCHKTFYGRNLRVFIRI